MPMPLKYSIPVVDAFDVYSEQRRNLHPQT